MKKEGLHPSGLTWERWNNPFRTAEERKIAVAYNRKKERAAKQETQQTFYNKLEEALW